MQEKMDYPKDLGKGNCHNCNEEICYEIASEPNILPAFKGLINQIELHNKLHDLFIA